MQLRYLLSTCLFILVFLLITPIHLAHAHTGLTDKHLEMLMKNPDYAEKYQKGNEHLARLTEKKLEQRAEDIEKSESEIEVSLMTVPVVVHLVYGNESDGANMTDAQVFEALDHINGAFRNTGLYDPSSGADTQIELCLATKTPENLPSNGITRHFLPQFADIDMITQNGIITGLQDSLMKMQTGWDRTKYLNIWVVREICDSGFPNPDLACAPAAYAFLAAAHGLNFDGIVTEAEFFGTSPDESKVLVHEIGHYFNLEHTFYRGCRNTDCLRHGDYVCDTPPDLATQFTPCATEFNSCSSDGDDPAWYNPFANLPDQPDMTENYMDYNHRTCQNTFTQGQRDRMRLSIQQLRASLLESDGCQTVFSDDAGIVDAVIPTAFSCDQQLEPVITLSNHGNNTLNSVHINYRLDNGTLRLYQWTGNLPSGSSVNILLDDMALPLSAGKHQLNTFISQVNGGLDSNGNNNNFENTFYYLPPQTPPFTENFESSTISSQWAVVNHDNNITWQNRPISGCANNGSRSIYMDNVTYANAGIGQNDFIYTQLDLTGTGNGLLNFDVAYISYRTGTTFAERLKVIVSDDCGATFEEVYNKVGDELATTSEEAITGWQPSSCSHWRTETISLADYAGQHVIVGFVCNSRYGNNLYLDNIRVSGSVFIPCFTPENFAVDATTDNSVDLSWDANETAVGYGVRYRVRDTNSWITLPATIGRLKTVSGLQPNTDYEIQVKSVCEQGAESAYTFSLYFTTDRAAQCNAPSSPAAIQVATNSALIRWTPSLDATGYLVRYGRVDGNRQSELTDNNEIELTGLRDGTSYQVEVRSNCNSLNSSFTAPLVFTTISSCHPPEDLQVSNITTNSAQVNWTGPNDATYLLQYRQLGANANWVSVNTDHTFFVLQNLLEGKTYEVKVKATCTHTESNFSIPRTFTVDQFCVAPTGLRSYSSTSTSAELGWNAGQDANAYTLRYRIVNTTNWTTIPGIGTTSRTLTGLTNGSSYECQVASVCGAETSEYSPSAYFITSASCDEPTNVVATIMDETTAYVEWDAMPNASAYEFKHKMIWPEEEGWRTTSLGGDQNNINLTDLEAGAVYEVKVRTICTFPVPDNSGFRALVFSLLNGSCAVPNNLGVSHINSFSALASWSAGTNATAYTIRHRAIGGSWQDKLITDGSTNHVLTNLEPSTTYEFQVRSMCGSDVLPYTHSILFTTTDVACDTPNNLNATEIGNTQLVTWQANPFANSYTLRYKATDANNWTTLTNILSNTYQLNNLGICENYVFSVQTICDFGASPYSEEFLFTSVGCLSHCDAWGVNSDNWVTEVQFADISNTSGNDNGYGDFKQQSSFVATGGSYELSLSSNATNLRDGVYSRVWIDFNQDGNWNDTDELVFETESLVSDQVMIDIPETAPLGNTIMRVVISPTAMPAACGSINGGEVEDYSLNIIELNYCDAYGVNAAQEWIRQINFGLQANVSGSNNGYRDYSNKVTFIGKIGETENVKLYASFPKQASFRGAYWSAWIDFNKNGIYETNERVIYTQSNNPVVQTSVTIPDEVGTGLTKMRLAMSQSGYPDPCEIISHGEVEDYNILLTKGGLGGNKISLQADTHFEANWETTVYPNPVRTHFSIDYNLVGNFLVEQQAQWTNTTWRSAIFNAQGQQVAESSHQTNDLTGTLSFNVSHLPKGIYFLQLHDGRQTTSHKLMILD